MLQFFHNFLYDVDTFITTTVSIIVMGGCFWAVKTPDVTK